MGEYYYLACKKCKEMVFLGKIREGFGDKEELIRDFMSDHLLHPLVITGDSYNIDHEIINFNEDKSGIVSGLWETKYKFKDKVGE